VRSLLRAHGQREPAPPYPILDISEAPEAVETVLINQPELPPMALARPPSGPCRPPSPTRPWRHRRAPTPRALHARTG